MKRIHVATLVAVAISCLSSSQAWATTWLQNNYGAQIQYAQQPISIAYMTEAKTLGNGARTELRVQGQNAGNFFNPPQQYLSIRSVGGSYSDLSYLLAQIENEQQNHRGK